MIIPHQLPEGTEKSMKNLNRIAGITRVPPKHGSRALPKRHTSSEPGMNNVSNIYKFSSYITKRTLPLHCKHKRLMLFRQ
jgi:hypothetical protein